MQEHGHRRRDLPSGWWRDRSRTRSWRLSGGLARRLKDVTVGGDCTHARRSGMAFHFQKCRRNSCRLVARGHTRKASLSKRRMGSPQRAAHGTRWDCRSCSQEAMLPPSPKKVKASTLQRRETGARPRLLYDQEHDGVGQQHDQNTRQSAAFPMSGSAVGWATPSRPGGI